MDKNKTKRPFNVQVLKGTLPSIKNFDAAYAYIPFRLFSADSIIGAGGWNCSYCPKEVLQKAAHLWEENVLRLDHKLATREIVGTVVQVWFDEGSIQDGVRLPAGVNGFFKVSRKEFSKEVELLESEPAGIRYTSAGISFEFEPSHEFEEDWDFWWHVGQTINGEFVHFKITKIDEVFEQSLVWEGADPCAVMLGEENDEIIYKYLKTHKVLNEENLKALKAKTENVANFKAEFKKEMPKGIGRFAKMTFVVNPQAGTDSKGFGKEGEFNAKIVSEAEHIAAKAESQKEQGMTDLEEKLKTFESDLKEKTTTITKLQVEVEKKKVEIQDLTSKLELAQKHAKENEELITFSKNLLDKTRNYAKEVYIKQGKELPSSIEAIIDKSDFNTLNDLIEEFGGEAMRTYGTPKCTKCGSQEFVIRNSEHTDLPDERESKNSTSEDALDNFYLNQTLK
ncbi:coiled-coil domain-containing protein [Bernardetia sp.]|uniref:coiled-coil domain-containing protein n=1 Tax=Bernardetia sp. TaxID=1937974 RepID=UPI0025BE1EBC|nr:hypothetical protein [Bernardetia sp.]